MDTNVQTSASQQNTKLVSSFVSAIHGIKSEKGLVATISSFVVGLSLVILFSLEIPSDISDGVKAQNALETLSEFRQPLHELGQLTSRILTLKRGDPAVEKELHTALLDKHERLLNDTRRLFADYREASLYNKELYEDIRNLEVPFNDWIAHEKKLNQFRSSPGKTTEVGITEQRPMLDLNELLLGYVNIVEKLNKNESKIHNDLHRAYDSTKNLTLLFIAMFTSLVLLLFFYKRQNDLLHNMRDANLEMTMRSIGDAVIATDINGRVTCMSPEAERLTGNTMERSIGAPITDIFNVVSNRDGENIGDLTERVKAEKGIVILKEQATLISADGSYYHIHENGAPIFDIDGKLVGIILVFRDVTKSKALQSDLKSTVDRLQRVIDTSMDAVVVADGDGVISEWNPNAEAIFGWKREEILGKKIQDTIIPPSLRESHLRGVQKIINSSARRKSAKRIESLGLHKDGTEFPINLTMAAVKLATGWIFNAYIRDLTDIKINQDEMFRKNAFMREAQRLAKIMYWELDVIKNQLYWTDDIYEMLGLDPEVVTPTYDLFLSRIPIDDREKVNNAYMNSLKDKTPYNVIHRLITKDGIRYINEHCENVYDELGNPIRSLGVAQDVTDQYIKDHELRLEAAAFNSHTAIMITDRQGVIQRVNPALEELTGYDASELIGNTPKILQSGIQDEAFYEDMWKQIAINGRWDGELRNRRKDGSQYAHWLSITAVKGEGGTVTNYVATSQDVAVREVSEAEVKDLSYHDPLTGLINKKALFERYVSEMKRCRNRKENAALLLIDINEFKEINHEYGHKEGDYILSEVSKRLKNVVNVSDAIARLSGDKFIILTTDIDKNIHTSACLSYYTSEQIIKELRKPYKVGDKRFALDFNIGLNIINATELEPIDSEEHFERLIDECVQAIALAKSQGPNTSKIFDDDLQQIATANIQAVDSLRTKLETDHLDICYTPQFDKESNINGVELGISMDDLDSDMKYSDMCLRVSGEVDLSDQLELLMIEESAKQLQTALGNGVLVNTECPISVKVDYKNLTRPEYIQSIEKIFNTYSVAPVNYVFEISEKIFLSNKTEVQETFNSVRRFGANISVIDTGEGYSAHMFLNNISINSLIIDMDSLTDYFSDIDKSALLHSVLDLAKHLDVGLVAQNIRDDDQFDDLVQLGVDGFRKSGGETINKDDFVDLISERAKSFN